MRVRDLLDEGALALPGDEARREAALLLRHALDVSDAWLITHMDDAIGVAQADAFRNLIERRARAAT